MNRICRFLAFILCAIAGGAQTARVTGKAIDPSGGVVVGADVTLLGPGNTTVAAARTGTDGSFTLDVPPGSYALEVSAEGSEEMVEGISASATGRPLNITLAVAGITQQVDVEDNPNLISL